MDRIVVHMDNPLALSQGAATWIRDQIARTSTSVNALADATHIPRVTLIRRLDGTTPFSIDELRRIAHHFGVSASDIVTAAENDHAA